MKAVYFGSDSFAIEPLEHLMESSHEVAALVSRPSRPSGRGLRESSTAVATRARELSLPLLEPEELNADSFGLLLEDREWDVGVVVAYGGLIPAWLLSTPQYGFVNLHPSLLPRYRGAAPVERALMNGASITGVTTIVMNECLDEGDILLHQEEPIGEEDTAETLAKRLSGKGAGLLVRTLDMLEAGEVEPVPQEESKATYAPAIEVSECRIDWRQPAERIERLVRACTPRPGAYTFFRGKRIKVWKVRTTDVPPEDEPGTIMSMGKEGFLVNTGSNCLQVVTVQPEGKKKMSAGEFSRGRRILIAESFTADRQGEILGGS